jgi:phage N-6-adenine-methyltransferase
MKKHKFNIFPEMPAEDFARLKDDIKSNGYDGKYPVYLYEGDILDGWNRYLACIDLDILPPYQDFRGNEYEAMMFVLRTNKRRNLSSSQWAAIAVEAQEIIKMVEDEVEIQRRKKQSETQKENEKRRKIEKQRLNEAIDDLKEELDLVEEDQEPDPIPQLIAKQPNDHNNESAEIIAQQFNTNRSYISEASKLKEKNPEKFEAVKNGQITLTAVKKDSKKPKALSDPQKDEWYTPDYLIKSARNVMEKIDLDPASTEIANKCVDAEFFMTKEKGCLDKKWFGNVWLNPPFSAPLISQFAKAVVEKRSEYNQAIILCAIPSDADYLHSMFDICDCVCIFKGRVNFFNPEGEKGYGIPGVMALYFGPNINDFAIEFMQYGTCFTNLKIEADF